MKIAIVGGSRGLGRALALVWAKDDNHLIVVARRTENIKRELDLRVNKVETFAFDLSYPEVWAGGARWLAEQKPDIVAYVAGGGPYGEFDKREFKDHVWSYNVSFVSASLLLFELMRTHKPQQMLLVGSAIAETVGDRNGASYAAAKHALVGLYQSLRMEQPNWDLRLYSPGYMDTELLPPQARPRVEGWPLQKPAEVASRVVNWLKDPEQHGAWWVDSGLSR